MKKNLIAKNIKIIKESVNLYHKQQEKLERIYQIDINKKIRKALRKHIDEFIDERRRTSPYELKYSEVMKEVDEFLKKYKNSGSNMNKEKDTEL